MNVQGHRVVPGTHAAQQTQAVRAHGARRPDLDDATAARDNGEELVPRAMGRHAGDHELRDARADGQLNDLGAAAARRVVDDTDLCERRLPRRHSLLR